MSRRLVLPRQARDDLRVCSEHIRRQNPRAALRFLDAAQVTFRRLAARPGLGTRYDSGVPALAGLRYLPVSSKFRNYIVFYRSTAGEVQIARVVHGARDLPELLSEGLDLGDDEDEADPNGG